jgi:hypothetical protein
MKGIFFKIGFIVAITLTVEFLSLGFVHSTDIKKQTAQTIITLSLDTIKPGPITRKQLVNIRGIRIVAAGANGKEVDYRIDSCTVALIPKHGVTVYRHIYGNKFKTNLYAEFGNAVPGDMFLVGNLKIAGLQKFKTAVAPMWTFVEDKKK